MGENETVIVNVPSFFEKLGPLLEKTPKRTVANYMLWRITAFCSFFLNKEVRKKQQQYASVVSGTEDEEPRWKECVDIVSGSVPISVGALYIRKYFQKEAKTAAQEMVDSIRKEFEEILKNVPWMDKMTRQFALEKLNKMATYIGYPEELMNDQILIDYYKDLEIDENRYLESMLNLNIFATDLALKKLREVVNKTDWKTHGKPAVVNAYYSSIQNSIRKSRETLISMNF